MLLSVKDEEEDVFGKSVTLQSLLSLEEQVKFSVNLKLSSRDGSGATWHGRPANHIQITNSSSSSEGRREENFQD